MPSGEEMYLWWSGEAESMFVYYLTGTMIIAFIATLSITRSLRRTEPVVTELLHEDNTREILVAYMLKLVTSVSPGSGCPESAKVFMQLTGENKLSQYFQLRSNTGGKAMLQRGFTDIFLFKVPESVGEIKSVEMFVAGLNVPLKWKLEEVELYCPRRRVRINLPVTVTLLELLDLDPSEHILVARSFFRRWEIIQLLFHQWLAGYGNSVRVGAFTEVVHAMSVFVSLFTLLVLSQICYICLPRGDYVAPTEAPSTIQFTEYSDEEDDKSGPFDIKMSSLLIGAALASAGCSLLTLCVEILLRSVKSVEKDPGKAYQKLCDRDTNASQAKMKSITSEVQFKRYFIQPLFLSSSDVETDKLQNIQDKDHKHEVVVYLKQLINYLQGEHDKYMKQVEAIRKKKEEEALKHKLQLKKEQALKLLKEKKAKEKQYLTEKKEKEKQDLKEKEAEERQKLKEIKAEETWMKAEDVSEVQAASTESASIDKLEENSEEENEIEVPTLSDISLSEFVLSEPSAAPKSAGSYLDILKKKRQTNSTRAFFRDPGSFQQYEMSFESDLKKILFDDDDNDDDNEYSEAKGQSFFDASGRSVDMFVPAEVDISQNAKEGEFDNIQAVDDPGKSHECLIDIPESDHTSAWQQCQDDAEESVSSENLCKTRDWIKSSERSNAAQKGFVQAWQANQKAWCRKVIKDLCDVIRSTREKLIADELCFFQMQSRMLDSSHSILQLLLVACSVHCNEEHYKTLMSKDMLSLLWHLSMEIVVNVLHEVFHVLQLHDSAVLADLVLQSHHVMLIVRHAVYPVMVMLQYGSDQLCLLRYIPLEKDLHCMVAELAKCCFELVVKYNLTLWQKIKVLVDRELKDKLDEDCYIQLVEFVQSNIQEHSTEQTLVKRLCNMVEDDSREETWEELHDEKKFYSYILIKVQVLKILRRKITNLTRKKMKFDKVNDLLPKEPKSRLQLLVEKRRKPPDTSSQTQFDGGLKQSESKGKHLQWSKELLKVESETVKRVETGTVKRIESGTVKRLESGTMKRIESGTVKRVESGTVKRKELEKQSKELGQFIENLSIIYEKLKKMLERQGINQSMKGSVLLAQAVLHPHVIVTLGEANIQGMYQFYNFLHLKRTENFLAQFYEVTVKDLMAYLLNTVVKEYNVQYGLHVQFDSLVNDVLVKVDSLAEALSQDVETMMHRCIKMEPSVVNSAESNKSIQIKSVVKPSVSSLLRTPFIQKWSGLDLKNCTPSEMSELGKMMDNEDMDMTELLEFYKNNSAGDKGKSWSDENNNTGPLDTDDIQLEVDNENWSLTHIIEDLRPLKGYLEYLKHGELLRNVVTQMGYIERTKHKREYFNTVQINNIIDSYYMLDEGDDSQTLTKAGLYQLEHDCTGEDQKTLPPWVKTLTVTLMLIALVLIVVYITIIGGQFSTTELQEWMCYFLLAVAVFGLVLEQFRAYAVSVYVHRWRHAVGQQQTRTR